MVSPTGPLVDDNGGFAAGEQLLRLHLNESPYGPPPASPHCCNRNWKPIPGAIRKATAQRHGASLVVDDASMDDVEDPCAPAGARCCCTRFPRHWAWRRCAHAAVRQR